MGNCYNSTVVDASIEKVWETIKNFHDLSWAEPVVTGVDPIGDKGGLEVGAKRLVNDAFYETLTSVNADDYTFNYSIDDGPEPLSKASIKSYLGTVKLSPVTDTSQTFVQWTSAYQAADDNAVGEMCNPIYEALLGAMKTFFKS